MKDDGVIVAYLARAVKNEYIRLSKKNCKILNNETPLLEDQIVFENSFEDGIEIRISLKNALASLTPVQQEIIKKVILQDKREDVVAREMNISRQAVNKAKQRAIMQLRNYFVQKRI
jgi:RNA polymerase sigma factor (sigma-70 family)